MGKVLLDQFKAKLAKKIKNNQDLGKLPIKIDVNDFANKRNQIFISCLSEYLTTDIPCPPNVAAATFCFGFAKKPETLPSLSSLETPGQKAYQFIWNATCPDL